MVEYELKRDELQKILQAIEASKNKTHPRELAALI